MPSSIRSQLKKAQQTRNYPSYPVNRVKKLSLFSKSDKRLVLDINSRTPSQKLEIECQIRCYHRYPITLVSQKRRSKWIRRSRKTVTRSSKANHEAKIVFSRYRGFKKAKQSKINKRMLQPHLRPYLVDALPVLKDLELLKELSPRHNPQRHWPVLRERENVPLSYKEVINRLYSFKTMPSRWETEAETIPKWAESLFDTQAPLGRASPLA